MNVNARLSCSWLRYAGDANTTATIVAFADFVVLTSGEFLPICEPPHTVTGREFGRLGGTTRRGKHTNLRGEIHETVQQTCDPLRPACRNRNSPRWRWYGRGTGNAKPQRPGRSRKYPWRISDCTDRRVFKRCTAESVCEPDTEQVPDVHRTRCGAGPEAPPGRQPIEFRRPACHWRRPRGVIPVDRSDRTPHPEGSAGFRD